MFCTRHQLTAGMHIAPNLRQTKRFWKETDARVIRNRTNARIMFHQCNCGLNEQIGRDSANSLYSDYLNNQVFKKLLVCALVLGNTQNFLASRFFHGIHHIILCLKKFDSWCIQLHWVFTAQKLFFVWISKGKYREI